MEPKDLEEFEDFLFECYEDEINDALHLIEKELLPPSIFCDPIAIQNFRDRLRHKKVPTIPVSFQLALDLDPIVTNTNRVIDENTYITPKEEMFEELKKRYNSCYPDGSVFDSDDIFNKFRNAVEMYLDAIKSGFIPPLESMIAIAHSFELYLEAAGALSLESVFFGKPRKGSGNFANQRSKIHDKFSAFDNWVKRENGWRAAAGQELKTLEAHALDILKIDHLEERRETSPLRGFNEGNIDSFLRGYRRWKLKNDC